MDEEIRTEFNKIEIRFEKFETRFDSLEKHLDSRFDEIHRILLQFQSDLHQFYFKLGEHENRLDNLEGKS